MFEDTSGDKLTPSVPPADRLTTAVEGQLSEPRHILEPQSQPQQKSEQDGQLQALFAERKERQKLEAERDFLKQMISQPAKPQEPEYDPEELVTHANVANLLDKRFTHIEQKFRQNEIYQMEVAARQKYPDFDEVFLLTEEIAKNTPGLGSTILNAPNPAEVAYALGKSHPSYLQKQISKSTSQVADKINSNLNTPPTLGSMSGSGVKDNVKNWSNAPAMEVEAEIRKILMGAS